MSVDYAGAVDLMLPLSFSFNTVNPLVIVEHCTGGDMTIEAVHATFLASGRSTHFAVGRDGRVAQFVPLSRGAGGNCCPDSTHDSFWDVYIPRYPNLNLCTISIEHCNDSQQSLPLTQAQMDASNKLNLWLCQKFHIDTSHIKGHSSINATNCPGPNFDFQQLFHYINQGNSNPNMEQQFDAVWFSVSWAWASGIYAKVKAAFMAGEISACYPLDVELKTVDWNKQSIQFLVLSNGLHAEWNNQTGECHIYDAFNHMVV